MEYPWTKYINMDNLPNEDMKIVANVIGLEATIKIMCELQGVNISVPQNATLSATYISLDIHPILYNFQTKFYHRDLSIHFASAIHIFQNCF